MAPVPPAWLDALCQQLVDNDPSLVTVELTSSHRIDDVTSKLFARALEQNHTCTTLILSCHSIVDDGAFVIASVLAKHDHIQKIQFRDLRNHREVKSLLSNLVTNRSITELSFRHCQFCPLATQAIQTYFGQTRAPLVEVRLVDCQLQFDADTCVQRICQGLQHLQTLQRVYLLHMEMQPDSARHIAPLLSALTEKSRRLMELHLGENHLGDEGMALLARQVGQNSSLSVLDVRSNSITEQGALSLQGMLLSKTSSLRELCLIQNELGSNGAAALGRGLMKNTTLTRLLISDNDIDQDGAKSLAHMLRANKSLQVLDISMNQIGNDGARYLANVLTKNNSLQTLIMRRNGITDEGATEVAKLLPIMQGLKELVMNKNSITNLGSAALLEALHANTEIEYLAVSDDAQADRDMLHLFRLNQAGRRILKHQTVPCGLWPKIYGRIADNADNLYFFVKARPEMVPSGI
jgi:Ran GTPase-activating protein (RanGAP) involved in mRNA processing and transport